MSDQTVGIVKLQELNGAELESVQALIVEGGEVRAASLRDNLKFSRFIALIVREGQLACVGAIKEARPGYIQTFRERAAMRLTLRTAWVSSAMLSPKQPSGSKDWQSHFRWHS